MKNTPNKSRIKGNITQLRVLGVGDRSLIIVRHQLAVLDQAEYVTTCAFHIISS